MINISQNNYTTLLLQWKDVSVGSLKLSSLQVILCELFALQIKKTSFFRIYQWIQREKQTDTKKKKKKYCAQKGSQIRKVEKSPLISPLIWLLNFDRKFLRADKNMIQFNQKATTFCFASKILVNGSAEMTQSHGKFQGCRSCIFWPLKNPKKWQC